MAIPPDSTVSQWLAHAVARLPADDGRHVAELLLGHALQRDRAWLFAHARDSMPVNAQADFEALLARRIAGEPVAYLLGKRGFWTLDLQVTPATLIPRADTERLVELALERLPTEQAVRVADLGTGSGAIALAIASERPLADVIATDASPAALEVARANAAANQLARVQFRLGSWWQPLAGERFELVVSNPPYIAAGDPHLGQGDLRHEPATALASGVDGLDDIRVIIAAAPRHLHGDGWLLLEHGHDQGAAVRQLLSDVGFIEVVTEQDLEHRDRVTLGCWPG